MSLDMFYTALLQSLILVLTTYGVMIPFRIIQFADLSAEGAYPLGGTICASLLLMGFPSVLAVVLATLSAGVLGVATALVSLRLKVNSLLSGIILSTMIYSVNLRMLHKPNVALFQQASLFYSDNVYANIVLMLVLLSIVILPICYFFQTEAGLNMRAVGLNPAFSKRQGISVTYYTVFGLFLGSALAGLSGGLMVELQQYMDVGMGVGIVIHALAALLLGEVLTGTRTLKQQLLAPLVGALVYQQIQAIALGIGLAPSDLKCFTGLMVLLVIALRRDKYANV